MTSSDEDVNIPTTCFCLIIFISSGSGYSGFTSIRDRSIDRSINRSVVIKAPYALTTKSHLELFSPEHLAMKILLFSEAFTVNISLLKGQCGRV